MANIKTGFRVGNMWHPTAHPLAMELGPFDFSTLSSYTFDLEREQTNNQIDFVQTLYVNNFDNLNTLTILLPGGQELNIPAGASGYYPAVCEWGKFVAVISTTPAANLSIQVIAMNVPVASQQWGPIDVNVAAVTATFTPTVGTFNDHSGNAGANAQLFAANALALRRLVQNPATSINSIFIAFSNADASLAGHVEIPPGASFDTGTGPIDTTRWNIYAAAATAFTAKEMT